MVSSEASTEIASRIGSYREPRTPPNSPTRQVPRVRQRIQSWEMQPMGKSRRLSDIYVPEREPNETELSRSPPPPEFRSSTPQNPPRAHLPTPATCLKGGFAGVEQEIWEAINISNLSRVHLQNCLHQLQFWQTDPRKPRYLPTLSFSAESAAYQHQWLNSLQRWKKLCKWPRRGNQFGVLAPKEAADQAITLFSYAYTITESHWAYQENKREKII